MEKLRFTKMQGAGNDFIIVDLRGTQPDAALLSRLAAELCPRRLSVGADGLMAVTDAKNGGDFGMLFFNSDGTLGEMCGNGARCIACYGWEKGIAKDSSRIRIESTAGMVIGERLGANEYRVRLNDPSVIKLSVQAQALGRSWDLSYVELGNPGIPHAVLLMENWQSLERQELSSLGAQLRRSEVFPKGANVSFVSIAGEDSLEAITFERGVEDFTLACGTGCGSIVTALSLRGLVSGKNVRVSMPGGLLSVSLETDGGQVTELMLTGPVKTVFEGECEL
jgi:diaminopimelate epimerase